MAENGSSDSVQGTNDHSYEHSTSPTINSSSHSPQQNSSDTKSAGGEHLEKGISHREHVDLNQNLEAR